MQRRQSLGNNRIGSCNSPPPRLQQLSPQIQKTQWKQSRWHIELQPPDNSGAKGSWVTVTMWLGHCLSSHWDVHCPRTHVTHLQCRSSKPYCTRNGRGTYITTTLLLLSPFLHGGIACGSGDVGCKGRAHHPRDYSDIYRNRHKNPQRHKKP